MQLLLAPAAGCREYVLDVQQYSISGLEDQSMKLLLRTIMAQERYREGIGIGEVDKE